MIGALVFLLPFTLFGLVVSWPMVLRSIGDREVSADPGGLPRYPVKALLLLGFAWLLVQGLSELVKSLSRLRGGTDGSAAEQPAIDAEAKL